MKQIIERSLSGLTDWQIHQLREMLLDEKNTWEIAAKIPVPRCVISFLRSRLALFLRMTENKSNLTIVYQRDAA